MNFRTMYQISAIIMVIMIHIPLSYGDWIPSESSRQIAEQFMIRRDEAPAWKADRSACSGGMTQGGTYLSCLVKSLFQGITTEEYNCRVIGDTNVMSLHGTGRAVDIMIPTINGIANSEVGDPIANWLIEHAEDMGIQYLIWDRTSWNGSINGQKHERYTGPDPHINHIHVEINLDGAEMTTPWFDTSVSSCKKENVFFENDEPVRCDGGEVLPCSDQFFHAGDTSYTFVDFENVTRPFQVKLESYREDDSQGSEHPMMLDWQWEDPNWVYPDGENKARWHFIHENLRLHDDLKRKVNSDGETHTKWQFRIYIREQGNSGYTDRPKHVFSYNVKRVENEFGFAVNSQSILYPNPAVCSEPAAIAGNNDELSLGRKWFEMCAGHETNCFYPGDTAYLSLRVDAPLRTHKIIYDVYKDGSLYLHHEELDWVTPELITPNFDAWDFSFHDIELPNLEYGHYTLRAYAVNVHYEAIAFEQISFDAIYNCVNSFSHNPEETGGYYTLAMYDEENGTGGDSACANVTCPSGYSCLDGECIDENGDEAGEFVCNDAVDNDGDGRTDCNDTDCQDRSNCNPTERVSIRVPQPMGFWRIQANLIEDYLPVGILRYFYNQGGGTYSSLTWRPYRDALLFYAIDGTETSPTESSECVLEDERLDLFIPGYDPASQGCRIVCHEGELYNGNRNQSYRKLVWLCSSIANQGDNWGEACECPDPCEVGCTYRYVNDLNATVCDRGTPMECQFGSECFNGNCVESDGIFFGDSGTMPDESSGQTAFDRICETSVFCYLFTDGSSADFGFMGYDLEAVGVTPTEDRFGNPDSAFYFDGQSYLEAANVAVNFDQDYTIIAFLMHDSIPDWYVSPFAFHSGDTNPNGNSFGSKGFYYLMTMSMNISSYIVTRDSGAYYQNPSDLRVTQPNLNEWYSIIYRRNGSIQELFLNGELVDSVENDVTSFYFTDGFIHIGAPNYWRGEWDRNGRDEAKWRGAIDDLIFVDRVITDEEIEILQESVPTLSVQVQEETHEETAAEESSAQEIPQTGLAVIVDSDYGFEFWSEDGQMLGSDTSDGQITACPENTASVVIMRLHESGNWMEPVSPDESFTDCQCFENGSFYGDCHLLNPGPNFGCQVSSTEQEETSSETDPETAPEESAPEPEPAETCQYMCGWQTSQEIIIDHTQVWGNDDLEGFTVTLTGGVFSEDLYSNVKADGSDLRFSSDPDGAELIPFMIDFNEWDPVNQSSVVYVKVPVLYANQDTTVYAWYSNPDAEELSLADPNGSYAAWDDRYQAVWTLSEGAGTRYDSTANENHLTDNNSVSSIDSIVGRGAYFGGYGTDEYLSIENTDNTGLDTPNDLTFEAWVNITSLPEPSSNRSVFSRKNSTGYSYSWVIRNYAGSQKYNWWATESGYDPYEYRQPMLGLFENEYYYLVIVRDSQDSTLTFYVNGEEVESFATEFPMLFDAQGGYFRLSDTGEQSTFEGSMDEVRFSDIARSPEYLKTHFNNQSDPSAFAYSGQIAERTVETEEATENPANMPVTENTDSLDLNESWANQSAFIDGLNGSSFTVEAWINLEDTSQDAAIISEYDKNGNSNRTLMFSWDASESELYSYISEDGYYTEYHTSDTVSMTAGEWNHVAMTVDYSSHMVTFYLNGQDVGSRSTAYTSINTSGSANFAVGTYMIPRGGRSLSQSKIDNVRVWNVARTRYQIQNSMNLDVPQDQTGLVANWRMDGNLVDDVSGSSLNQNGCTFSSETPF